MLASYNEAYTTSLGDFLKIESAKRGIPVGELEQKVIIKPIKVTEMTIWHDSKEKAIRKFDLLARDLDAVVDLREGMETPGFLWIYGVTYYINGTGVRFS